MQILLLLVAFKIAKSSRRFDFRPRLKILAAVLLFTALFCYSCSASLLGWNQGDGLPPGEGEQDTKWVSGIQFYNSSVWFCYSCCVGLSSGRQVDGLPPAGSKKQSLFISRDGFMKKQLGTPLQRSPPLSPIQLWNVGCWTQSVLPMHRSLPY